MRFNEIKYGKKYSCWFSIDFIFCSSLCCLGFSISHVNFSEVTSVWGVSAVAIVDCSLNVYACGRQKALTMSAYCIAANCNNSQATQINHEPAYIPHAPSPACPPPPPPPPGFYHMVISGYLDHQSTQFRLSASELLLFVSVVLVLINALYGIPNCDDLVS